MWSKIRRQLCIGFRITWIINNLLFSSAWLVFHPSLIKDWFGLFGWIGIDTSLISRHIKGISEWFFIKRKLEDNSTWKKFIFSNPTILKRIGIDKSPSWVINLLPLKLDIICLVLPSTCLWIRELFIPIQSYIPNETQGPSDLCASWRDKVKFWGTRTLMIYVKFRLHYLLSSWKTLSDETTNEAKGNYFRNSFLFLTFLFLLNHMIEKINDKSMHKNKRRMQRMKSKCKNHFPWANTQKTSFYDIHINHVLNIYIYIK